MKYNFLYYYSVVFYFIFVKHKTFDIFIWLKR